MADGNAKHGPSAQSKVPSHFIRHHDECTKSDSDCNYTKRPLPYEAGANAGLPANWAPQTGSPFRNHHVLPVSSLAKFATWDAYSRKEAEAIYGVYAVTNWCSSRKSNLIRLPMDPRVRSRYDMKLPAHNRDHNSVGGYNDQVIIQLHLRVWSKAKKATGEQKHSVTGDADISGNIKDLEDEFRRHLLDRGKVTGDAGDSLVEARLTREELIAKLKLQPDQKSWRK